MIRFFRAAARAVKNEYALSGDAGGVGGFFGAPLFSSSRMTAAGKTVNAKTAMEISVAYDCVRKTAQTLACLPLVQYQKNRDGSRSRVDDELSEILTRQPNSEQTAFEFWEGQITQLCLRGNAYAKKLHIGNRLVGLVPLFGVTARRDENGKWQYEYTDRGKRYVLPGEKVFHLRGFGAGDGMGMSTISYGAASLGAALAADESAASVFSNGMNAAGVLTSDQLLNESQRGKLQEMLEVYTGSRKAGKIMTLEAGLKYQQLQLNPGDAQLLETRRFSVEDVCRWFGVPPIVVGHASQGQTMWGTGIEAILVSWLQLGINPLATRIEKRTDRDLLTRRDRYFEFTREAMLQMDSKSKADFMSKMGMSGTMTANERREKLNLPRHDDPAADALLAQTALAPLNDLGESKNDNP